MGDLLKLAERCEAATGPDRRTDAAIAALVTPEMFDREDAAHYARRPEVNRADLNFFNNAGVPRYTASLDAAMTLVPEGSVWGVSCDDERPGLYRATVMPLRPPDQTRYCATPALALTVACLRARDRDASLAEDAKRLSPEGVAARAEGIAQGQPS